MPPPLTMTVAPARALVAKEEPPPSTTDVPPLLTVAELRVTPELIQSVKPDLITAPLVGIGGLEGEERRYRNRRPAS
jgi:hypothetical protein